MSELITIAIIALLVGFILGKSLAKPIILNQTFCSGCEPYFGDDGPDDDGESICPDCGMPTDHIPEPEDEYDPSDDYKYHPSHN